MDQIPAEALQESAPPTPVLLKVPREPLFVGAYSKIPVRIGISGLSIDDLDFSVPEGPRGGLVSLSRDHSFNPKEPDVMLLAGYEPGSYRLQVLKKGTTTVIGEARFAVTDEWKDTLASPPLWYTGILQIYTAGATWGGGPSGPQNINVHPASGTKRLMILFVDTNSQRYTTDAATLQGFQTRWRQNVVDGFTGMDGVVRSVRKFYQEVSYNNLDIAAQIFGNVVNLTNAWESYFELDINNSWRDKGQFHQQCVTAAGSSLDLTNIDMLVCVSQGFSTATPNPKIAWPYGGQGVALTTAQGNVTVGVVSMPNEWGDGSSNDQSSGRTIYETLSHELGHTLSLKDEYTPTVAGRNIGDPITNTSWDPMDWERPLPHFTLAHRMMLGWVPASWLRLFNFQSVGAVVDQTVTLSPIEDGAPPAGLSAGIEVRIGDGRNYYFEYRTRQPAEIGDRSLSPNSRVVGTDVSETPATPIPTSRPDILLLDKHGDDNGAVLDNNQFYHERDNATPTFPADFRLDVSGIDGTKADVRIRYSIIGKPDPAIRPWPKDDSHQWQSPDIEVRNARQAADPAWANVPWLGHDNTVVAHITNRGTLSAPRVVAKFFVKDWTLGGAPENSLGSDQHDINPGATVEFTTRWNPPREEGHFCIIVRIDPYQTPTTPPVPEMNDTNNVAQSNYDRFISATSSPASRQITRVTVGNPFDKPTRVFIAPGQNNPIYRSYLEHTWLQLNPGETKQVMMMFEYAPEPHLTTAEGKELVKKFTTRPNNVGVVSYIENPHDPQLHQALLFNGVTAEIVTGNATEFAPGKFFANDESVSGVVLAVDDGNPVPDSPDGKVLVIFTKDGNEEIYQEGQLTDGQFDVPVPGRWRTVEAYYVPAVGYGDSTSGILQHSS